MEMEQTLEQWEVESYIDRTHPFCPWPAFRLVWMEKPKDEIEPVRQLMDAAADLLKAATMAMYPPGDHEVLISREAYKALAVAIAKARGEQP
jgi:hypothetical protein